MERRGRTLILPAAKARQILRGSATQHRRQAHIAARVGQDIPLRPGAGKPMLGRARIERIVEQRLGDITYHEARAEGHRTTDDFKADWVVRHDTKWIGDRDLDEDALLERFASRWSDTMVSVITLRPVADEPRYLASQLDVLTGHTDDGEYTTRRGRAIDDLEVVDERTMERYAAHARPYGEQQRAAAQAQLQGRQQTRRNARLAMFKRPAQGEAQ